MHVIRLGGTKAVDVFALFGDSVRLKLMLQSSCAFVGFSLGSLKSKALLDVINTLNDMHACMYPP